MNNSIQFVITLAAVVLLATGTSAKSATDSLWIEGQAAYTRNDYVEAIQAFTGFLDKHPSSVAAMYNLGNCYVDQGDIGMAVLWYERALKLRPLDGDVRHNLSIAKARRDNAAVEIRQFFLLRWIRGVANLLSPGVWGAVSVLLFWVALGLVAFSIHQRAWYRRRLAAITCGSLFLLAVIFGTQRYTDAHRTDVAIITSSVPMTIAPDAGSKQISILGSGEKVVILDSLQQYFKVRVVNFEQGWVPVSSLNRI